ncbi:hypothetical protein [Dokdonella sp.]|uniref:hypothetical protein n=1 Tax=Dokdonella sp. TaxID=2291710 RepID=UPI0037842A03
MDSADRGTIQYASEGELRAALETLSDEDWGRLRRAGQPLLFGTEYTDALELVHEAVARAMRGARGERGRRWPLHVPLPVFLFMTMSSVANASVEAPAQSQTDHFEDLIPEGVAAHDFAIGPLHVGSTESAWLDEEERAAAARQDAAALAAVETHFDEDDEVLMLVFRLRDGQRSTQIRKEEGWTATQYATIRRRLRRALAKLAIPGKAP